VQVLQRRRENVTFLPGIRIPRALPITADLAEAVASARIIVLAIPSQYLRAVVQRLKGRVHTDQIFVSVAKGIERGTLKRMTEIVQEELAAVQVAALSGPNIAMEIAKGQPASSVVASANAEVSARVQRLFMSERFRLYTSDDVVGVELGGALKNPVAIAAGIGDGLGFGANAKAALITRGIVEMARLGVAMGAREETFWGLSGLGDLITTCLGGRNRWLGEQIGKGKTLTQVLARRQDVIEGVETAKAAVALARRFEVELPIIEQAHAILFRRKDPRRALQALMTRSRKAEFLPSAH
jgi:glycerol-3-phosphate dehydrogenase (NAD(P)+)